jgi:hypothetical protein
MNERIRELMIKAFQSHYGDPVTPVSREKAVELVSGWGEKFAELIIKECAEIVEHSRIEGDEGACLVGATKCKIKQHFGVEECLTK